MAVHVHDASRILQSLNAGFSLRREAASIRAAQAFASLDGRLFASPMTTRSARMFVVDTERNRMQFKTKSI